MQTLDEKKSTFQTLQCETIFDAYKECKSKEYDAKRKARIDARKASGGKLFG